MNTDPLPPPTRHRQEIDGLRAVAVLLVAVYHVWFGRFCGGVDVFLLLTGFLVTGSLVRAAERGGPRHGAFLGRLAVRLVPTAALVITVSLLGARLLLPEARWRDTVAESLAAASHRHITATYMRTLAPNSNAAFCSAQADLG